MNNLIGPAIVLLQLMVFICQLRTNSCATTSKNYRRHEHPHSCNNFDKPENVNLSAPSKYLSDYRFCTLNDIMRLTDKKFLSITEKERIISTAETILNEVNPNRVLHRTLIKTDPLRRLKRIRNDLNKIRTPHAFHLQMIRTFMSLNDGHTFYDPPEPLRSAIAVLGFRVGRYYERISRKEHFIVTETLSYGIFDQQTFVKGVELLNVDGEPVRTVAFALGKQAFARRIDDSIRYGIYYLTFREFSRVGIPKNKHVTIEYRGLDNKVYSMKVSWQFMYRAILQPEEKMEKQDKNKDDENEFIIRRTQLKPCTITNKANKKYLIEIDQASLCRLPVSDFMKNYLFSSVHGFSENTADVNISTKLKLNRKIIEVNSNFSSILKAERIQLPNKIEIGRLEVSSFDVGITKHWFDEVERILKILPKFGLVIDVRWNHGGNPYAALGLWEMLTEGESPRCPLEVRASQTMLSFIKEYNQSGAFLPHLAGVSSHLLAGYELSGPFGNNVRADLGEDGKPVSRRKRVYMGPFIALTSSISASATEIFASIVKDNGEGMVVGVDASTNGAGATIVSYAQLNAVAPITFPSIVEDVQIHTAFARYYRSGAAAGELIEHFGVPPNLQYFETKADIFNDGVDMYRFLSQKLEQMRQRKIP